MKIGGTTLLEQVESYIGKHNKKARAAQQEVKENARLEASQNDRVISNKIVRDETVTETTEEVITEVTTTPKLYWEYCAEDKEGNVYIRILRDSEQNRINEMVEVSRLEYVKKLQQIGSLQQARLKEEHIDAIVSDDKRSRVRPGASILFGNNIEVIPARHAVEKTNTERKVTTTTKKYVKTETVILRGEM